MGERIDGNQIGPVWLLKGLQMPNHKKIPTYVIPLHASVSMCMCGVEVRNTK